MVALPASAAMPTGGFAVIWHDEHLTADSGTFGGYDTDGFDTKIRYFDSSGSAVSDPTLLCQKGSGTGDPSAFATSLGDGRIALVYASTETGGVDGTYEASTITPGPVAGTTQTNDTIASLGSGNIAAGDTDTGAGTTLSTLNADGVAPIPPAPTVAFDAATGGFTNGTTPILSGFVSANATGVELFDGDPAGGGRDLGAAIVSGDGTWTFQRSIGAGDFSGITAVATDASGQTGSAAAPYELVTAVTGTPYRAIEYDDAADGSYGYDAYGRTGAWLMDAANNGDGTHTIQAFDDGQQLHSAGNDTVTGNGSNESFVFFPTFGHDEVTDFRVAGAGHDTVDLTGTQLRTLAQVLRHTTMAGGDAVLHLYGNETVTLDGVTKAQLKAHSGDFPAGLTRPCRSPLGRSPARRSRLPSGRAPASPGREVGRPARCGATRACRGDCGSRARVRSRRGERVGEPP